MNERIIPDYGSLLAGKTAFITTAARGIGRSIARLFARQGATVYFAGRNPAYVKQTEAELRQLRPGCRGYVCDLAQSGESEETARQALEDSGGLTFWWARWGSTATAPWRTFRTETWPA